MTNLDIALKWKVPAERMTFEPVIGEDSPQVRVIKEEHSKHVPYLPTRSERRPTDNSNSIELTVEYIETSKHLDKKL